MEVLHIELVDPTSSIIIQCKWYPGNIVARVTHWKHFLYCTLEEDHSIDQPKSLIIIIKAAKIMSLIMQTILVFKLC